MLITFSKEISKIIFLESFLNEKVNLYSKKINLSDISGVIGWGIKTTSAKARKFASKNGIPYISLEDGFVCSYGLRIKGYPPLSLIVDKVGIYYNAKSPSMLEEILNFHNFTHEELKEGQKALEIVLDKKISKFNYAPFAKREILKGKKDLKVLLIDQTCNDYSIIFGMADKKTFEKMYLCAKEENPDADIYVKIHPDVISGKKRGYLYDIVKQDKDIYIISEDVNSLSLLEYFAKVYTVSSQMGFEALLLGKEVHCFGLPFYANWGLTLDKLHCPRRKRKRSILELFTASYIKYCRYINPKTGNAGSIFNVIDFILKQRHTAGIIGRKNYYFLKFNHVKQKHLLNYFKTPFNEVKCIKNLSQIKDKNSIVVVWGAKGREEILKKSTDIKVLTTEDGFIRSVGLGAEFIPPMSIVKDNTGIYYDSTKESDLEKILNNYQFSIQELESAEKIKELIIKNNITKYNVDTLKSLKKPFYDRKVIVIPGQVETDQAVVLGEGVKTNYELIKKVRQKNPDAYVIYKPHPDVLAKNKRKEKYFKEFLKMCNHIETESNILSLIEIADEVHTISSLSGFEALVRGKPVHTYGGAFYAGWGLTFDELSFPRRKRKLTLQELIAGVLLVYPVYYDWKLKGFVDCETVIYRIIYEKNNKKSLRSETKIPYFIKKIKNWIYAIRRVICVTYQKS